MTQTADRYDPLAEAQPAISCPTPDRDHSIPGDLVLIYPEGSSPRLVVRTPVVRDEWGVPEEADEPFARPTAPPVAIQYRGEFYRVSSLGSHGSAVEYRLDPWPDGEILRRTVSYSRNSEIRRRSSQHEFAHALRIARLLVPLYPVIGLLPAELQLSLAARWPIAVDRATLAGAVVETLAGGYLLFFGTVVAAIGGMVGTEDAGLPARILGLPSTVWLALAPVLLASGVWRWWRHHSAGHISGMLVLEALMRLLPNDESER
jgi:hypothetical protein